MLAEIASFERDFRTGDALWSDNHYRIFGVDKESFKNTPQNLLALVHPDDHDRFHAFNRDLLAGRAPSTLEYRIIRPDGACSQIVRETESMLDADGTVIGMRGTVRDVTQLRERKRRNGSSSFAYSRRSGSKPSARWPAASRMT